MLGRCIFTRLLSGKKQAAAAGAQAAQALTRDTVADEIDAVRAEHENVRFQLESYKIEQEPAILGIMLTTFYLFGRLHKKTLQVDSTAWGARQCHNATKGLPSSSRMAEAVSGRMFADVVAELKELLDPGSA